MNGADTAWILTATALVLLMTLPGLALFYGGLVRARNVLSVFMHCFAIACLMSVLWVVCGYSIAFGSGGPVWGGLAKVMLAGIGPDSLTATSCRVTGRSTTPRAIISASTCSWPSSPPRTICLRSSTKAASIDLSSIGKG